MQGYSQFTKAIVALLTGLLTVVAMLFHKEISLDPAVIGTMGAALTTVLVYAFPNKIPKDGPAG